MAAKGLPITRITPLDAVKIQYQFQAHFNGILEAQESEIYEIFDKSRFSVRCGYNNKNYLNYVEVRFYFSDDSDHKNKFCKITYCCTQNPKSAPKILSLLCDKYHTLAEFKLSNTGFKFYKFTLQLELIDEPISLYKDLYDDADLTDFELRGDDGEIVAVHRSVLAASSPVMKKMIIGDWKESIDGFVTVAGVTKTTLQHFKDYIYLKKMPSDTMECLNLLSLAKYYMMPELEKESVKKICTEFETKFVWDVIEYCWKNRNEHLLMALLKNVDEAKMNDLTKYFSECDLEAADNNKDNTAK